MPSTDDDLVTIGTFSMLTGLSIPTLRHYDDLDLLKPADVDPRTSYRRYAMSQVDTGRRIRLLREADLSTHDIRRAIGGDTDVVRDVLARHRAALHARADRVGALLDQFTTDFEGNSEPTMSTATDFRLATINIGVNDDDELETAVAFWSKVLGADLEDWGQGSHQVVLGEGDAISFFNIRVRAADEPQFGHRAAFGLGVAGLEQAHARALAAGAVEHYGPTDGEHMPRHSRFADPVGNRVVLWESS
jgi:DNA-binding transcriptional MerR regulator